MNSWSCEELTKHIICDSKINIIGSHTYNFSENYEIIDFSFVSDVSHFVERGRKKQKLIRLLNKLKNHIL